MGIVFRQTAKNSIIVFFGAILGALIVWLSTRFIPKQEYGFINNVIFWSITLSQFLLLGLHSSLGVYIHKFADSAPKRKLLITLSLLLPLIFTAVFILFFYLFRPFIINHYQAEDRPLMNNYFIWFPICTILFIYITVLEVYLVSQLKVAISSFSREIIVRILNIILLFLFAWNWINFSQLLAGLILIYLVPVVIFFIVSLKTKSFGFSLDFHSFSKAEYKELLHFSWYHFLLGVSIIFMSYMDSLLLPIYDHSGYAAVAVYRNALFFIALMQIPTRAFMPASFAVLSKAFADYDLERAKDIFVRSSINIFIPTVGVAVIISCNLDNVIAVIPADYREIIPVFYILLIGTIVNLATGMNDQVLSIAKYYQFNFYVSLILIALLFVSLKFSVPRYGIYGAAWSASITLLLFNIIKFVFIWKKLDMQPFSSKTLLIIIAALPALAAGYFCPYLFNPQHHVYIHSFIDAIVRTAIIAIIYAVMLLLLKPSPDLTEYITSIRKNKRLF